MLKKENTLWVEKYRPSQLDEYVGNEHLKTKIQSYLDNSDVPHLLLYGRAGTGKTTLAKLIVSNLDCDHLYVNASDETSVENIRTRVKSFATAVSFSPNKIVILDEMDYISPNAQAALRNIMEVTSKHTRFILTCNYIERVIEPLQSRCQTYNIVPPSKSHMAQRLSQILDEEIGKENYDLGTMALVVDSCYPDLRKIVNYAQRQVVNGKLVVEKEKLALQDYKIKILEILKDRKINKGDAFKQIRKCIADNNVRDYADLFTLLFDKMDEFTDSQSSVAKVILILADYQQKDLSSIDKEINAMALFVELLGEIK